MDLATKTATDLADLVRGGQVSPVEVVRAHLARIESLNARVQAFQVVRADKAIDEARALERRDDLAALPLAGVPVAIKDSVDVAGEPTRHGSAATVDTPAPRDDEIVRRLRDAGCIVVGKTTQPELAIVAVGDSVLARPRNPWNLARTTGGSSAGSGAALAAGMVPIAQGSDGGGSIRIPSACCGVFGIKPTPGLVPCAGGAPEHWFGLSAWGPMATTVADAAAMLDALAATKRYAAPRSPAAPLRIAMSWEGPGVGVRADAEMARAVESVGRALRACGHSVERADPPYPPHGPLLFLQRYYCGIARDVDEMALPLDRLEPRTQAMVKIGRFFTKHRPVRIERSDAVRDRFVEWFRDFDVLLAPTLARTAVDGDGWLGKTMTRTMIDLMAFVPFTQPWNVAGFPAASIPAGLAQDGLPRGVQIVAAPGHEARILSVAAQIEQRLPWKRHAPI